jgi:hypothetical protein
MSDLYKIALRCCYFGWRIEGKVLVESKTSRIVPYSPLRNKISGGAILIGL